MTTGDATSKVVDQTSGLRGEGRSRPGSAGVTLMLRLTFVTGVVDAVGYLAVDRVSTGNMTGNVVILAMALGGADDLPVLGPLSALATFTVGALVAGLILRRSRRGGRRPSRSCCSPVAATTATGPCTQCHRHGGQASHATWPMADRFQRRPVDVEAERKRRSGPPAAFTTAHRDDLHELSSSCPTATRVVREVLGCRSVPYSDDEFVEDEYG